MRSYVFELQGIDSRLLHAQFVILVNRTHGYMYYLHANNNIFPHSELKDIPKQTGKLENY